MADSVTWRETSALNTKDRIRIAYYKLKSLHPKFAAESLEEIIDNEDWKYSDPPCKDFEEMLRIIFKEDPSSIARKFTGISEKILRAIPSEQGSKAHHNNIMMKQGDNPTYKLKRLKREAPELAERVIVGELTANAAYIEAGFAKRKMTVEVDPDKVVSWIRKYFTEEEIEYIKNHLT